MSRVTVLREVIERTANELRQTSALATLVKQGKITPRAIALYLESLRYLFSHSPALLRAAAQRSDALGRVGLGDYFRAQSPRGAGARQLGQLGPRSLAASRSPQASNRRRPWFNSWSSSVP